MRQRSGRKAYAGTLLIVAGCTALALPMRGRFDLANVTMLYLLGVVVSAVAFGRGPAIVAAALGVAVFDFAFVPPQLTFEVADTQYLLTFGVMLAVAVVIGTLTARLRGQRESARLQQRRTAALHRLSRDLAARSTSDEVVQAAVERIGEALGTPVLVWLPDRRGHLAFAAGTPSLADAESDRRAAQRVYESGLIPGGPGREPGDHGAYHVPLVAGLRVLGVLSVPVRRREGPLDPDPLDILRALASQTALALERCRLAEDAQRSRSLAESERARSALLSSVSHDLRTPLAAITGAASSLRGDAGTLTDEDRSELADTIAEEARRLNRLIGNLLDMTRLESGSLRVRKEWHLLEEIVGATLARLEPELDGRQITLSLPGDLPLVPLDDVLFEQVIRNLVENAHKYSPPGAPIELRASAEAGSLRLEVADRGPGIGPDEEEHLFEKFYRSRGALARPGAGLGLAICRGIVEAHFGSIEARNRSGGGSVFIVRLPLEGPPPVMEGEAVEKPQAESPP